MKPRITFLTLGVADLEKSLNFYRDGLGLSTQGIVGAEFEGGSVVVFELKGGLMLALFPKKELAKEAGIPVAKASPTGFSIGYNVNSREEVDQILELAKGAGAIVPSPAKERSWGGYTGYFQDPDKHLWEIAFNPGLPVAEAEDIAEAAQ